MLEGRRELGGLVYVKFIVWHPLVEGMWEYGQEGP